MFLSIYRLYYIYLFIEVYLKQVLIFELLKVDERSSKNIREHSILYSEIFKTNQTSNTDKEIKLKHFILFSTVCFCVSVSIWVYMGINKEWMK